MLVQFKHVLALGLATMLACGGDEAPKPKADTAAKKPKKAGAAATAAKSKVSATLEVYAKIAETDRRVFQERDFIPDSSGSENRDPFRSYVVRQGISMNNDNKVTIQPNEICDADNSSATSFGINSLKLIGIVLQGTSSYAMFRDQGSKGWIVHRGDCLGKEKGVVKSIGVGSVTLEVIPETPPNSPPPPPRRQDIALYPEDLDPSQVTGESGTAAPDEAAAKAAAEAPAASSTSN